MRFSPWLPPLVRARFICLLINLGAGLTFIFAMVCGCYTVAAISGTIALVSLSLHSKVARNWENLLHLSTIGPPVSEVVPDIESTFCGIHYAHWEIDHILIVHSLGRCGIFTRYERWRPLGVSLPGAPAGRESIPPRLIRFTCRVGEKGQFGHKGYMHREVTVTSVEEVQPLPDPNTFW